MEALIDGIKVPKGLLGALNETDLNKSNENDLRNNLEQDGYLFLRNVINYKNILKARNDIFKKLNEVNELEDPFVEGIASGQSSRDKMHKDRGLFWKNLSNTKSLRQKSSMTAVTAKKNLHDEKGGRGCKYIRQDEGVVVWCRQMQYHHL